MDGWAAENGMAGASYTEIVHSETVKDDGRRLRREAQQPSRQPLGGVKKWELLDHDLTVESGELTPSMKVKRNVVEDNYRDNLAALYA